MMLVVAHRWNGTLVLLEIPYSRLFSCGFNFRTAGAGRKLDFEKFFLPINIKKFCDMAL